MSSLLSSFFSWRRLAGNRRLFLVCLLLFTCSALLSFWLFFPAEVLQRRLVEEVSRQTGIRMQGENPEMLLPLGLQLDLSIDPDLPELVDFRLADLQISPVWSSLFTGKPEVHLQGNLAGGQFDIRADQHGNVSLKTESIAMEELQRKSLDYRVNGRLSGQLEADKLSAEMEGEGEFALQLAGTEILGLEKIGLPGTLPMGLLLVDGKFNRNRVSFEKIVASQGVLELSGGGTLLVGDVPEKTRLNLSVRLHPTPSTPDVIRDLLSIAGVRPAADGSYLLRIGGTLARPVIR